MEVDFRIDISLARTCLHLSKCIVLVAVIDREDPCITFLALFYVLLVLYTGRGKY